MQDGNESHRSYADRLTLRHARENRRVMTKPERLLWSRLRGTQLGHRFRRQHPIDPYIADFACVELKLCIEIDGRSHRGRMEYDANREQFLVRSGWSVARFTNLQVLDALDEVVEDVLRRCESLSASATPT